jgi:hypothetical protein
MAESETRTRLTPHRAGTIAREVLPADLHEAAWAVIWEVTGYPAFFDGDDHEAVFRQQLEDWCDTRHEGA